MATNRILSDKGLVRGSVTVTIDGYQYLLKTGTRQKPSVSNFEKDENGLPGSSSHAADFQKLPGEIMARTGTPEPAQRKPFLYDGLYWAITALTLNFSTEGLRSYTIEVTQLAGTSAADFVETP